MEKTIKYLEGGEYHYATVRSVGDLAQLKTNSKETLVEAINELWNGGGSGGDPTKAPKPEGYDQLVQDVADTVNNIQQINQAWVEWQKADQAIQEERKQDYLKALKEMNEAVEKAKSDAVALKDRTDKLDEEITKTFSVLDTSVRNMHERLNAENERLSRSIEDTKSELESTSKELQNAQLDNGKIHNEVQNLEDKFNRKIWNTDLDPLKEQINHNSTEVQQTKNELLEKADRKSFDTLTGTVENLNTQVKKTAEGVELSVKKAELGGEIAEALTNKSNILQGTRRFTTNKWFHTENVTFMSDSWKGFKVAKQTQPMEGITQAIDVKAGITYTFSLYAWIKGDFGEFLPILVLYNDGNDYELVNKLDNIKKDLLDITDEPRRYSLTFTPSEDCTIYPQVISYNISEDNYICVCGFQLEIGKDITPWEPNQEDIGDYVEKSEAQFNVYNDKIQAITEKQRQQGETQEQLRTQVTQTAEGTKQVSEQLKSTNGDVEKLRGQIDATASHLKTEYEEYTNKVVGQISDSTLNLIRNSSFMNRDDNFSQWQNISTKANIREDGNGLRWVELTQSGLNTNNPEGITSNYFKVSQGKVTIAVDIKAGASAMLDNEEVLSLEVYNDSKKRVDFYGVTLTQLGLSETLLNDHQVHRGLYRLGIDRQDATYMTVKAKLVRNGDLYFTNFSARLSSIDDGAYEPNPDDLNQQILKQNTKIEQGAKEIALRAKSADVTREIQGVKGELSDDIKSAKDAAIKVASDQVNISVNELSTSFDDKLNKRTNEIKTAYEKFTSDGIEQTVHKITDIKGDVDRLGDKVNGIQVGTSNLLHHTDTFEGWHKGTSVSISTDKYLNGSVAILNNSGSGGNALDSVLDITNDEKYITWTIYAKADNAGDKLHTELWGGGGYTDQPLTTKWQRYKFAGNHADSNHSFYLWGVNGNKGKVYVALPFAVVGNTTGTWMPNAEDINKKIDLQTLDNANIDDMKTTGHYFVHNLNGNPIDGWVYVDVVGDNAGRIRQDVYQDSGIHHKYRRWFGDHWTGWEESASQSDLNNIKTEVTASVKNLGDRVTTEVTGLTSRINGMKVGGRNLLKGTRDFDSKYWYNSDQNHSALTKNPVDGSVKQIHSWSDWASYRNNQVIELDPNKDYMISADIAIYGNDGNGLYVTAYGTLDNQPGALTQDLNLIGFPKQVNNEGFKRIYLPLLHHGRKLETFRIEGHGNWNAGSGSIFISKIALYEGNTQQAWMDSSDDFADEIKELNTKWDVANGQIQGKVTETQVNNILNGKGYATQSWAQGQFRLKSDSIDLEVKKITDPIQNQVNNIKVGGRNLFAGTNNGKNGWTCSPADGTTAISDVYDFRRRGVRFNNGKKSTQWWVVQYPFDMAKLKPNTDYTFSFDVRTSGNTNGGAIINFARGDSSGSPFIGSQGMNVVTQANKVTHVTITHRTGGSIENNGQSFYLNSYALGQNDWVDIFNLMVVEGNSSGEWQPAPEDMGDGANLLRGTADFSWPTGIGLNNNPQFSFGKGDTSTIAMHIWGGPSSGIYTRWAGAFPDGELAVGEQYTFSFDIQGSGVFGAVGNEGGYRDSLNGIKVPATWQRMSVTGRIESLGKAFIIYFSSNYDVFIKNVKIERGAVATPWSPHPNDNKDRGINLYHGTSDWSGDWNSRRRDGSWYSDGWKDSLGNLAMGRDSHAWSGLGQTIWVPRGVYTFSCQLYLHGMSGNDSMNFYCGDSQYNGTAKTVDISKPNILGVNDQNKWINYVMTIYVYQEGNLCIRPELNQDHGVIHVGSYKLEHGMVATPWNMKPTDNATGEGIVSKINISPDQIRIASKKIEIDGNTYIHGTLNVPEVKLQGKSGVIDLSGEEINIAKTNGSGVKVAANGIQLTANTNGQQEIEGVLTTAWSMNNKNQNGIGLVITPEQTLGRPYGGDILTIGEMPAPGVIHAAMVFDATGINPDYKRGFNWFAPHTLNGDGGILRFPGAQDDLLIYPGNIPGSRQSGFSQPTMTLINGSARGGAGIQFQWNDLVPFGRVETSHTYFSPVGARADSGLGIGWVHWSDWGWDGNVPMIHRRDANGGVNAGFAFFSSGDTVWWKGGYRSNLIGSLRQTDGDNTPQIGGF